MYIYMDRTQENLNFVMKMDKTELMEWIIDICMQIAEEKFLTDELLIDEYITKKEEAYIDSVNILREYLIQLCEDSLRKLIFKRTTLMTLTVHLLKEKKIIKNIELIPVLM